ncbi:MAG: chemotaxis protein CheY [Phycisphaerae bacterium SG8_4]|nr:MAG: chemotaxis protein CheY [Phycisphaerae bacterium SG8_4]
MNEDMVILIAEDDAGHFQLIKKNLWLACVNNEILQFKDGQQILDFLFQAGNGMDLDETKQYIVLLDVRMPKVDGLDVLRRIKGDEKLRQIPVIMLTTTGESSMIEQCYELGCSYYMVKPVDYHNFMQAVQNLGKFLSLEGMRLPSIDQNGN